MRVALIFNESAGHGSYRREDLVALLTSVGHTVRTYDNDRRSVRRAIRAAPDVLVAAGGDGTVARVATIMHKREATAPLYILPIGTANNIARTLGVDVDDVPGLALALETARTTRVDIGVVKSPWMKKQRFIEAAGFGFIGTMLEQDGTVREKLGRAKRAIRGAFGARLSAAEKSTHGVARLIREQQPIACRIRADGEDLDGEYIAVEVLNIRDIGPRVSLAPRARVDDDRFDLLLVRPADREVLAKYVESRGTMAIDPPGIRRRVRKVKLSWPASSGHLDDEPWPGNGHGEGRVRVRAGGAIRLLLAE
jgi:diacylglycerol kinase (ATP)